MYLAGAAMAWVVSEVSTGWHWLSLTPQWMASAASRALGRLRCSPDPSAATLELLARFVKLKLLHHISWYNTVFGRKVTKHKVLFAKFSVTRTDRQVFASFWQGATECHCHHVTVCWHHSCQSCCSQLIWHSHRPLSHSHPQVWQGEGAALSERRVPPFYYVDMCWLAIFRWHTHTLETRTYF